MKTLLLTILLCLVPGMAYAEDAFVFGGCWSVHPIKTMEYAKKSPKYNPSEDAQFEKAMLRMMNAMTITLSEDKMVYHRGKTSTIIPFIISQATETAASVSGGSGNANFTLKFTVIDGKYMNFKSSGSDDMDYYIWQRDSPKLTLGLPD